MPALQRLLILSIAVFALAWTPCAVAQEDVPEKAAPSAQKPVVPIELPHVDFPSLDGKTTLITHLFRPKAKEGESGDEPRPAVVMMHGCSGLLAPSGRFFAIYRAWARTLLEKGYVVLVVDSAKSRGFGQTCSAGPARRTMWLNRPSDAYAALAYLQAQSFVKPDRIALMGWSQGGGIVLLSINDKGMGRPADLKNDFAVAVSFYPGACSETYQSKPWTQVEPNSWTTRVPLLMLTGAADTWTLAAPCEAFLSAAKARGNPVELKIYPAAEHGFDAPNTPRTELPQYREPDGRIPVIGTDKEARADALTRVPAFLERELGR